MTSRQQPVVVKIGGATLDGPCDSLLEELRALRESAPIILVHGGGPQATREALSRNHVPTIIQGRRVTTDRDLDIHLRTVCGSLTRRFVRDGRRAGLPLVSLPGHSGTVLVERRPPWTLDGVKVDFGHVGEVRRIVPTDVQDVVSSGGVPVVTPSGRDDGGAIYNVNADTIALEVAVSLNASSLLFVTEAGSVLNGDGRPVPAMTDRDVESGIEDGWLRGGMRVKASLASQAVGRGIDSVWIAGPDDVASKTQATWVRG